MTWQDAFEPVEILSARDRMAALFETIEREMLAALDELREEMLAGNVEVLP